MSGGGGGGVNVSMPTYEGSLEQALRSQVNLLQGSGQFEDIGSLQNLVEQYERPLRMSQAQIGTDVLRQTLLGDEFPVTGFKSVKAEDTVPVKSTTGTGNLIDYTRGQHPNSTIEKGTGKIIIGDGEIGEMQGKVNAYLEAYKLDGERASKNMRTFTQNSGFAKQNGDKKFNVRVDGEIRELPITLTEMDEIFRAFGNVGKDAESELKKKYGLDRLDETQDGAKLASSVVAARVIGKNMSGDVVSSIQSQVLIPEKKYFKNEDGTDFVVPKDDDGNFVYYADNEDEATEAGGSLYNLEEIQTTRGGTGMVDLLGDTRDLTEYKTRSATQEDVDAGRADEVGDSITEAVETGRQAGFDDQGQFKGLSVLAEDIQRGNLSRQREADLADVERLSGRYSTLMEDFKPASSSGLQGARDLLEEQRENLTGLRKATAEDVAAGTATEVGEMIQTGSGGPISIPKDSTFGGELSGVAVDDPLKLTSPTSYDPSASVTGDGYTAQADLSGGTLQGKALRDKLMTQAESAIEQGLTDRERRSIEQASRARQTATGRIFDPTATIQEAQGVIEGDRNRQMQNRAFAQGVLGQEIGIQESDLTRGLQADMQNQSAVNRAAEFGASQDMQAQLANQAATNQALQFGVQAGMGQEGEQAGLQQRTDLTQADIDARQAIINQGQQQQANQFGVGATMDAERLNEQLRQQGLANYVQAVGNLSQIEKESGLDPFQALLGRGGGTALQQGQGVLGQASYGLQGSQPQYLNPESGLGFISQMAANEANMYAANVAADASKTAGLYSGLGSALGGAAGGLLGNTNVLCWVAREVYGPTNPAWLHFRDWIINKAPQWFFKLYRKYGERFALWISDKPRLKGIIRKWMDSKIGGK